MGYDHDTLTPLNDISNCEKAVRRIEERDRIAALESSNAKLQAQLSIVTADRDRAEGIIREIRLVTQQNLAPQDHERWLNGKQSAYTEIDYIASQYKRGGKGDPNG
jgi:hypothetical protein